MAIQQVLIDGQWRDSNHSGTFQATDPATMEAIGDHYPLSSWADCDAALDAAARAFDELKDVSPEQIASFLDGFADRIEAQSAAICEMANRETALPVQPRLAAGELPRTSGQLRQAAQAVRTASWTRPIIDSVANIRSCFLPLGPVAVFGPNNFPLAFGSVSGGDFAAAIAAGNPVIGKANSMHPGTTRLLAIEAHAAVIDAGLPTSTVQLIYRTAHSDGEQMAQDPRLAAIGYTGGRRAGLKLKAAADTVGLPIYLELSSVNPVVILPGALRERGDQIVDEFCGSCLMGTGQFCTNPGLVLLCRGPQTDEWIAAVAKRFDESPVGTLLSKSGQDSLGQSIDTLVQAGCQLICGGQLGGGTGFSFANTLLQASGQQFLNDPETMQTEAFGNASLFVVAESVNELVAIVRELEGNLTGCIYSDTLGGDDQDYQQIAPYLGQRVGRLLNDQMPTGVAVSPAMNHGGPYPATGHSGFTAVGMPAAISRFARLQCFDNVRSDRLPEVLRDDNPRGIWRSIDGSWSQQAVSAELATNV